VLNWSSPAGSVWYDVVRGDLTILRSTGGDFTLATAERADNATATSLVVSGNPPAGEGFWLLVRGVNCKGPGEYDSFASSQVGDRDAEINTAATGCP
jgi:hypothetical protein